MAQKAGHTAGPWDYDAADFTIYSVEPYGTIIGHSHYEPVIEANARLIAAAPDLLEALKQAEQQIDYGQIDAAHRIIIAAIAKAEGRS